MTVHPRKLARDYIADILLNPVVNDPDVLYRRVDASELTEELKDRIANALHSTITEFAKTARRLFPYHCLDCKTQSLPFYSVDNQVWREALLAREADELKTWREAGREGPMPNRWLCFPCLEARLGRPLTLQDFPAHLPINFAIHFGYSLAQSGVSKEDDGSVLERTPEGGVRQRVLPGVVKLLEGGAGDSPDLP